MANNQTEKLLFWPIMMAIIGIIAFLFYLTFFSQSTVPLSQDKKVNSSDKNSFQVKRLYICSDGAKIRSTPQKNGKILRLINMGGKISVIGEKDDWYQVKQLNKKNTPKKIGWIEKSFICDTPPQQAMQTEEKEPPPTQALNDPKKTSQEKQEPAKISPPPINTLDTENLTNTETLLDGLLNRLNSRTNAQFGQDLFDNFNILDGGMRFEARVTGLWGLLPQPSKTQFVQFLSNQYILIACQVANIVDCTNDNIPAISIVDSSGREIAYRNSSGFQIFE